MEKQAVVYGIYSLFSMDMVVQCERVKKQTLIHII